MSMSGDWDEASICYNCSKTIGGVSTMIGGGRHHCRCCGHSFCQACSAQTTIIPDFAEDHKPVRVCDTCCEALSSQRDGRVSRRRPSMSEAGTIRGWVKVKLGHGAVLDHSRWNSRFFELDSVGLRLYEKRSQALLRTAGAQAEGAEAQEQLVFGPTTGFVIENKAASHCELEWVLHIRASTEQCCSDRCLRLKNDHELSTLYGEPSDLQSSVVPIVWRGLLDNMALMHTNVAFVTTQIYGLKQVLPTNRRNEHSPIGSPISPFSISPEQASVLSPAFHTPMHREIVDHTVPLDLDGAIGEGVLDELDLSAADSTQRCKMRRQEDSQGSRREHAERNLDDVVQGHIVHARLMGEINQDIHANTSLSRGQRIGEVQSFDVLLTETVFLISLPNDDNSEPLACYRESSGKACFEIPLVDLNPVATTSRSFTLAVDSFLCTLHCPSGESVVKWVSAIADNIRRLCHVERSINISQPKANHSFVRLRHVVTGVSADESNPTYIQRAFRATYELPTQRINGFLAISDWPSRVWFVSRHRGTRLEEVSLSQIYNATLEAVDKHPLHQVLSFAIQRHTTDEWRLTFECPLEAEQAMALVTRDSGFDRLSSGQVSGGWFSGAAELLQQEICMRENYTSSSNSWVSDLKQKFHIPDSDTPQMVVSCCLVTNSEQQACRTSIGPAQFFTPSDVELVSGLLAVFNWALVFVADNGSQEVGRHSRRKQKGPGCSEYCGPGGPRHVRVIVMANQMQQVEWNVESSRLKLHVNEECCSEPEASPSSRQQSDNRPLEFHLVENGQALANCVDNLITKSPSWLLGQSGLRRGVSMVDCMLHHGNDPSSTDVYSWKGHISKVQILQLWSEMHPTTPVLDAEASNPMPSKFDSEGFDTSGFQLATAADWRAALDNCEAVHNGRQPQLQAIDKHLRATRHNSVQVVTQKLGMLAVKGFPPQVRGGLWMASTFAMTKARLAGVGYYETLVKEVTRVEAAFSKKDDQIVPAATLADALDQIHKDIDNDRTDSSHCLMFRRHGARPEELDEVPPFCAFSDAVRRVCCAFAMRNHTGTGYAQGMPSIVMHLLLVLPEQEAFWLMCCIFEDMLPDHMGCKGSNTGMGSVHDVGKEACKTLLENLLDDVLPHFWKYLEEADEGAHVRTQVRGHIFEKWMNCLFCGQGCGFPSETVQRILDLMFAQGFHMMFAVAIAIIKIQPLDPLVHPQERFCMLSETQRVIARTLHDADHLVRLAMEIASLPQMQPTAIWHAHAALVVQIEQYRLLCAASYEPGVPCQFCDESLRARGLCHMANPRGLGLLKEDIPRVVHAVADVNWSGARTNGRTALHCAARVLNLDMVEGLLQHPQIALDEQDEQGCTALHLVTTKTCLCRSGCTQCSGKQRARIAVVGALLEAQSAMCIQDRAGCTVLHNSSTGAGFFPLAQRILTAWWSLKHTEAHERDFLNVQSKVGYTALHLAAHHGILVTVDLLIKFGADVDAAGLLGETPLHTAAQNNQYEVVESLCANSARVDARAGTAGWMPLHVACCEGHNEVAYKLVLHQPEITTADRVVKLVDAPTLDGLLPLQIAVLNDHAGMMDFLKVVDACFPQEYYDTLASTALGTEGVPYGGMQDTEIISLQNAFGYGEFVHAGRGTTMASAKGGADAEGSETTSSVEARSTPCC